MMTPLPAPPERMPTVAGMTFFRTALTCLWIALRSSTFSGAGLSRAGMTISVLADFSSAAARPARSPASTRAEKTAAKERRRVGGDGGSNVLTENLPEQLRVGMTDEQYIVPVGPNRGQQIL